jgi:hypothetical protein
MTILRLKAQHDALQKIATTRDPVKALAEFVWNALDADATEVVVDLERNALGGIRYVHLGNPESILIADYRVTAKALSLAGLLPGEAVSGPSA